MKRGKRVYKVNERNLYVWMISKRNAGMDFILMQYNFVLILLAKIEIKCKTQRKKNLISGLAITSTYWYA